MPACRNGSAVNKVLRVVAEWTVSPDVVHDVIDVRLPRGVTVALVLRADPSNIGSTRCRLERQLHGEALHGLLGSRSREDTTRRGPVVSILGCSVSAAKETSDE
jgi:hypothetical protein